MGNFSLCIERETEIDGEAPPVSSVILKLGIQTIYFLLLLTEFFVLLTEVA